MPISPTPNFDPSPPVADQVTRIDYDRQTAVDDLHPDHIEKAIATLEHLDQHLHYAAIVAELSKEHVDEYIVDIYTPQYDTLLMKSIKAYPQVLGQKYDIDNRIKVRFLPNETCLILPLEIPLDTGIGKVLSIVDSGNPGTVMFDYPRFAIPTLTIISP